MFSVCSTANYRIYAPPSYSIFQTFEKFFSFLMKKFDFGEKNYTRKLAQRMKGGWAAIFGPKSKEKHVEDKPYPIAASFVRAIRKDLET